MRLAPGFGVDERELDNRLSAASQQAIRAERAADNNIAIFYFRYLGGLAHGDFGFSRSLNRPDLRTSGRRLPLTLAVAGLWRIGGRFARAGARAAHRLVARARRRSRAGLVERAVPGRARGGDRSAVFVDGRAPHGPLGHRAGGVPARLSLREESARGRLPIARTCWRREAKGLSGWRVLWAHIFTPAAPQLAALAGSR